MGIASSTGSRPSSLCDGDANDESPRFALRAAWKASVQEWRSSSQPSNSSPEDACTQITDSEGCVYTVSVREGCIWRGASRF